MTPATILYKNSVIEYYRSSGGSEPLICFHGYGEHALTFAPLVEQLSSRYNIVAINLPWHGNTEWKEGLEFTIDDLMAIISLIPEVTERFSVAGYSMGGRVALHLYQCQGQRINRMLLIAPDGLKMNGWYWLATQSGLGNKLFQHSMKKPAFFFFATGLLRKTGLINTGIYNFTRQFLLQEQARQQLYTIWTTLRKIRPDTSAIKKLLVARKTQVTMVYGEYDKVIRHATGERFAQEIGENVSLHILPAGHKLLQKKNVDRIAEIFLGA